MSSITRTQFLQFLQTNIILSEALSAGRRRYFLWRSLNTFRAVGPSEHRTSHKNAPQIMVSSMKAVGHDMSKWTLNSLTIHCHNFIYRFRNRHLKIFNAFRVFNLLECEQFLILVYTGNEYQLPKVQIIPNSVANLWIKSRPSYPRTLTL